MNNLIRIYISFANEKGHFINKAYDLTPEEFSKLASAAGSFAIKRLGVFVNKQTIKGSEPVFEAELREELKAAEEAAARYNDQSGNTKSVNDFLSERCQKMLEIKNKQEILKLTEKNK
jgi:uncharacterized protein with von Willebrand factor type A (vWA) domain